MWRYIDYQGTVQGPFPAATMQQWYMSGDLPNDLPVCGSERRVSPPNLPDPSMYRPLADLIGEASRGQKYQPISPEDIRNWKAKAASKA